MITAVLGHISTGWDVYRAGRDGQAGIARRQEQRLRGIVAYARAHSAYFADHYRDVPDDLSDVTQLPVVTKAEMMRDFDQWVTDPSVHRDGVEAFISDPTRIGCDYLDRYVACTTSGSTGTPAILLHDLQALKVYNILGYVRSLPTALMSLPNMWALIRGRGRLAAVFVTGGHSLGNTMMAR
jgi:phenylacetate-coenzyme A ligase PaaK-like adenylate-forming protein